MEKYTNNNKNSNRKNIFERIAEFREQKSRIQSKIDELNIKIQELESEYDMEFNKEIGQFSDGICADLQSQLNHYHNELSDYEKQLEDLKPIAKSLKKACLKIGAVIVASAIAIGGFAAILKRNSKNNAPSEPSTSHSQETKESTTQSPYGHLYSSDAILEDFKQRFIQEYNEKHGTSIDPSSIQLIATDLNYLYKTYNEQYVTHGSHPYETENILQNYGDYETISINSGKVYQVLINGTPLESYIVASYKDSSGKSHSIDATALSGNDLDSLLEDLENKSGLSETVLKDLFPLPEYVIRANASYHNQSSKDQYIKNYRDLVEKLDNQKQSLPEHSSDDFER